MKAFSGADRFNSLHNRHALAQSDPYKKGLVARVCTVPQGSQAGMAHLADIHPSRYISQHMYMSQQSSMFLQPRWHD